MTSCVWYTVQISNSFVPRIIKLMIERAQQMSVGECFKEIYAPKSKSVRQKQSGEIVVKESLLYGSYIFIGIDANKLNSIQTKSAIVDVIRSTPGVVKILGSNQQSNMKMGLNIFEPYIISDQEIAKMKDLAVKFQDATEQSPFKLGDFVRIKQEPFSDATGAVRSIDVDSRIAQVEVIIMGCSTVLEFSWTVLEKV